MSQCIKEARSDRMRTFCAECMCGENGTRLVLPASVRGRGPEQLAELCPGFFSAPWSSHFAPNEPRWINSLCLPLISMRAAQTQCEFLFYWIVASLYTVMMLMARNYEAIEFMLNSEMRSHIPKNG
jgi:hypothetical protein